MLNEYFEAGVPGLGLVQFLILYGRIFVGLEILPDWSLYEQIAFFDSVYLLDLLFLILYAESFYELAVVVYGVFIDIGEQAFGVPVVGRLTTNCGIGQ